MLQSQQRDPWLRPGPGRAACKPSLPWPPPGATEEHEPDLGGTTGWLELDADEDPFAFSELLARLDALFRRSQEVRADTVLAVGDLSMDLLTHKISRAGRTISLQPREFKLLEYLMRHANQVVTRTMLFENVWDYHFDPQTNVIDVQVSKLRQKIDAGAEVQLLRTIRNAGYMLTAND